MIYGGLLKLSTDSMVMIDDILNRMSLRVQIFILDRKIAQILIALAKKMGTFEMSEWLAGWLDGWHLQLNRRIRQEHHSYHLQLMHFIVIFILYAEIEKNQAT